MSISGGRAIAGGAKDWSANLVVDIWVGIERGYLEPVGQGTEGLGFGGTLMSSGKWRDFFHMERDTEPDGKGFISFDYSNRKGTENVIKLHESERVNVIWQDVSGDSLEAKIQSLEFWIHRKAVEEKIPG